MKQHWLDLEKELYNSFSVIAIYTGIKAPQLAYNLNLQLGTKLERTKDDLDLKRKKIDFYFPLFEYLDEISQNKYDLVGNRNIPVGKQDGIIHYEDLSFGFQKIEYLIPEFRKVDYFLKVDFNDNSVSLEATLNAILEIQGIQSAYIINNSLIESISNLIFD